MENINFYITKENEYAEWEEFNLKYGNIFQSIRFAKVLECTDAKIGILIAKEDDEIVAGALYFKPLGYGLKSIFSELRVVSGPVINKKIDNRINNINKKEYILSKLLEHLKEIAKKEHARSLIIKTNFDTALTKEAKAKKIFDEYGFNHSDTAPRYSFIVNLNKTKDELWRSLDKKTRNAIRKAQKSGVRVREVKNAEEVRAVFELYINRVKERDQVPIPYEYFTAIFNNVENKFLVAEYEINGKKKIIAESIFLFYSNKIYYFNNGSLPEYWNLNPNTLLIWHIMEKFAGTDNVLDLYGTPSGEDKNDQNYSMYTFKSGFGGKLIEEFEYYDLVISRVKEFIFKKIIVKAVLPIYKRFM